MKIILNENFLAVLQTENGEVVALFSSTTDAKAALEKAVSQHFGCDCVLTDLRDFEQPLDYQQPYTFSLHEEEVVYETLIMTYSPLYN